MGGVFWFGLAYGYSKVMATGTMARWCSWEMTARELGEETREAAVGAGTPVTAAMVSRVSEAAK